MEKPTDLLADSCVLIAANINSMVHGFTSNWTVNLSNKSNSRYCTNLYIILPEYKRMYSITVRAVNIQNPLLMIMMAIIVLMEQELPFSFEL